NIHEEIKKLVLPWVETRIVDGRAVRQFVVRILRDDDLIDENMYRDDIKPSDTKKDFAARLYLPQTHECSVCFERAAQIEVGNHRASCTLADVRRVSDYIPAVDQETSSRCFSLCDDGLKGLVLAVELEKQYMAYWAKLWSTRKASDNEGLDELGAQVLQKAKECKRIAKVLRQRAKAYNQRLNAYLPRLEHFTDCCKEV
nr:hypothetical protein [Tanacetum cinerariifolium]